MTTLLSRREPYSQSAPSSALVAAALIFWGWQTGILIPAILMTVAIWRRVGLGPWRLSTEDYHRVADGCVILTFLCGVVCFSVDDNSVMRVLTSGPAQPTDGVLSTLRPAYIAFQWLPMIMFPCVVVQIYGSRDRFPLSAIFWSLRRGWREERTPKSANILYAYLVLCIAAAAAGNRRDLGFYVGLTALVFASLWPLRPRCRPGWLWPTVAFGIAAGGFVGQIYLHRLQTIVENSYAVVTSGFFRSPDRMESRTALGRIGAMKLSSDIVLQLECDGPPPRLLREASFNEFKSPTWLVKDRRLKSVITVDSRRTWRLSSSHDSPRTATLSLELPPVSAIPLPKGTTTLSNLPATKVEVSPFGVVHVEDGPRFAQIGVHWGGVGVDSGPRAADYVVPEFERAAVATIANQLRLDDLPSSAAKVAAIQQHFMNQFTYSTYQSAPPLLALEQQSPLANFLLNTHRGHCEFFATAAVLLLRHAGVPARYATGYVVPDDDEPDRRYLVRERHGHAWCLYFDGAEWLDFDSTPAGWAEVEKANADRWQPVADVWSSIRYRIAAAWFTLRANKKTLGMAATLLLLFLLYRLTRRQSTTDSVELVRQPAINRPGSDSEFYQIEAHIAERRSPRQPGETVSEWLTRVTAVGDALDVDELLALHYRYRFDPHGVDAEERRYLRADVERWLSTQTVK